jgi:hypothetical protein
MLRSRKSRREESLEARASKLAAIRESRPDPGYEALLADSVGLAMLVVLETLAPAERVAFVLHDMFDIRQQRRGSWPAARGVGYEEGRRFTKPISSVSVKLWTHF